MKQSKRETRREAKAEERAQAPQTGLKVRTRLRAGMDDWEAPVV